MTGYLARSADGRPLVGSEEGFVPLPAAYPDAIPYVGSFDTLAK